MAPTCETCGCAGSKKCGHCHFVSYCSREHQVEDWRVGHSEVCKKIQTWKADQGLAADSKDIPSGFQLPKFGKYPSHFLFKEFEIVTDEEPDAGDEKDLPDIERDGLMSKYNDYVKNWTSKDNEDLNDEFKSGPADKLFAKFHNRVSRDPEQVLRYFIQGIDTVYSLYCRHENSKPLWVNTKGQPTEIPKCSMCGGERKFEFQILPQLLYYLKVDENKEEGTTPVDWGTLAVFSCWNSCALSKEQPWAEEFLWSQDITV